MRAGIRLLAAVKNGKYLEAGTPTGLTGLDTHPSPRSTLLYLYNSTLDKLSKIPESSVYRQSTEALTKHRLSVIEGVKPAGYDAWQQKIRMQIDEAPAYWERSQMKTSRGSKIEVHPTDEDVRDVAAEWDGEYTSPTLEGIRSQKERRGQLSRLGGDASYDPELDFQKPSLDPEPPLTADQISDLESRLGAGLIEEVIQVAEGEHKLVDEMVKAKVWEALEEPVPEGQWTYFERGGHTKTQAP